MKSNIGEYLKTVSRMGLARGTGLMLKKMQHPNSEYAVQLYDKNKVQVRGGTSDWIAFKQVFIWKEYDYPYNFDARYIIDAGANVGYAALWFAQRFPQAQIVSLEPEESNFTQLKKNTNGYANITSVKAGLWSHTGQLQIANINAANWSFRTEETDGGTNNTIQAFTIDDVVQQHRFPHIDILKMDVEGAEKKIFNSNYHNWLPLTRCLVIELHDNMEQGCSKAFFKAIVEYDFSFDVLGENLFFFNTKF